MDELGDNQLTWIGGLIAVQASVDGGNRKVSRILVQKDRLDGATARLQQSARDRDIPLERVAESVISQQSPSDQHGGVIAEVGPRRYLELSNLLEPSSPSAIFMIDGIEDPHNLGQAIRSLYAAGATGLVLRPRNWLDAGDTVLRASAGASELMPIAIADTVQSAAEYFRTRGLTIMAADPSNSIPMGMANLRSPFFLVVGGEKRGLTRAFLREADVRVSIPYGRPFDAALGTAAAAGILAYEVLRQRASPGTS